MGVAFALACAKKGADVAIIARSSLRHTEDLVKKETGRVMLTINGDI